MTYPFGDITLPVPSTGEGPPSKKRRQAQEPTCAQKGGKKGKITPIDAVGQRKYDCSILETSEFFPFNQFCNLVPEQFHTNYWHKMVLQYQSTALAKGTWAKYNSALNKFKKYSAVIGKPISWPISHIQLTGFTMWGLDHEKLATDTVKSYIFALSHFQQVFGYPGIQLNSCPLVNYLLIGAKNKRFANKPARKRQPITFRKIKHLKKKIFKTSWHIFNKWAFWGICLVAFFGSFRLGELLSKKSKSFDKKSTLKGKHVNFHKKSKHWSIWIKSPKSNNPQGEKVYLFEFGDKEFCPVQTLHMYQTMKENYGLSDKKLPFFRFVSGRNITTKKVNRFLKKIFPPGRGYNITGHSFRSGLISSAANVPDIINDTHIKGWGRWKSKAFLRYEAFTQKQRKYIFRKLSSILLQ